MKKISLLLVCIMLASLIHGCACKHQYSEATCLEPSKCELCGETQGEALGHEYSEATCDKPSSCSRCNSTIGTTLPHKYKDATCTDPKKCKFCGKTSGASLGHKFKDATCSEPKKCSVCGYKSGNALGHNFNGATCTTCGTRNPRYDELKTLLNELYTDMNYIYKYNGLIENSISLLNITSSSTRKQSYCEDIRDNIINIEECLVRIREECNGVVELKPLYDMCFIDVPEFSGTFASYENRANLYKVKASRVISTYNALYSVYK